MCIYICVCVWQPLTSRPFEFHESGFFMVLWHLLNVSRTYFWKYLLATPSPSISLLRLVENENRLVPSCSSNFVKTPRTLEVAVTQALQINLTYLPCLWKGRQMPQDLSNSNLHRYPSSSKNLGPANIYIYIYDPGLRFPTPPPPPPNVMTLSTLPIAPMTIWRPPCCFEGELAEIDYRITSGHVWSLEYLFMP